MRKLKGEKVKKISRDFMSNSTGCLHSKSPLTTLDPLNMFTENKRIPTLTYILYMHISEEWENLN